MTAKLAIRNVTSKIGRTIATAVAIAIAVGAIFLILSFKSTIFNYLLVRGSSDSSAEHGVHISYSASGDKTITLEAVDAHTDVVEHSVGTLEFYWLYGDEYVNLRGFEPGEIASLNKLDILYGSLEDVNKYEDNVIISKSAALHFGLKVGSGMKMTGMNKVDHTFTVAAIADDTGYFAGGGPYPVIADVRGVSRLIVGIGAEVYNNIYVKAKDGVSNDKLMTEITADPKFENLLVSLTVDQEKIKQNATSFSAIISIIGIAVMILAVLGIAVILLLSVNEKRDYIGKMSIIGASKKQIAQIFILETVIVGIFGLILGVGFAAGLYALILFALTGGLSAFEIVAWKMIVCLAVAFAVTVGFSLFPIFKAFKGSIRDSFVDVEKKSPKKLIILGVVAFLWAVTFVLSYLVQPVAGYMGLAAMLLGILLLILGAPMALVAITGAMAKKKDVKIEVKMASVGISRNKQGQQAGRLLVIGLIVAMLMFTAWRMTSNVFTGYINQMSNMVTVANIKDTDVDILKETEGVDDIKALIWGRGSVKFGDQEPSMNFVGCEGLLDLLEGNIDCITSREEIEQKLASGEKYIFLDIAMQKVYGVKAGDKLSVIYNGKEQEFEVGGITSSMLFVGKYAIVSPAAMKSAFNADVNIIMIRCKQGVDPESVVGLIRSEYAGTHNYYALSITTAYSFDIKFVNHLFLMIGILAIIISLMAIISLSATDAVAHGVRLPERQTLLIAGMSKKSLFRSEFIEHILLAGIIVAFAFVGTFITYAALLNAIIVFGMYISTAWNIFFQNFWIVVIVAFGMGAFYTLLPIFFGYKKQYKLRAKL